MSGPSGSSSLPAWKQALLERKRRPEDPEVVPVKVETMGPISNVVENSSSSSSTIGSTWKQTSLGKKLLKFTSGSDQDKKKTPNRSSEEGDVVPEIRVESTGSPGSELLVEDRLLPIKQNPILLSDRQKRSKGKSNHVKTERRSDKRSASPTVTSLKTSGSESNSTPSPSTNHNAAPGLHPGGDDSADEVFDEEVTYGKGFVHKLLQKFINLSGKDEPPPPPPAGVAPKPQASTRGSGDGRGGKTRNSSQYSTGDGEEKISSRSSGHSTSELTQSMQNGNTAVMPGKSLIDTGSKIDQEQHTTQSHVDSEELPANIVSAARDIFEHQGSKGRTKPATVEKLNYEQTGHRPALKKRQAPGVPSLDPTIVHQASEFLKNDKIVNHAGATEAPSGVVEAAKSEHQMDAQQNLSTNRILYSVSGTKKTFAATSESTMNTKVKSGSSRENSSVPSVPTGKKDALSEHPLEEKQQSAENDGSTTVGKVSSLVGSWGLKHSSRSYDAGPDNDERVNGIARAVETTGTKVKPTHGAVSKFGQHADISSDSNHGVNSSGKKEFSGEIAKTSGISNNSPSVTKVKVNSSGNFEPTRTKLDNASLHSNSSSANENVDISKDNSKLNRDTQRETDRNLEIDKMTTRIRVGGNSASSSLLQNSSSSDSASAHSVPVVSNIRAENQVTVIQIGDGVPPSMFPEKTENKYSTPTFEKQEVNIVGVENLQGDAIDIRKSNTKAANHDENASNLINSSVKYASGKSDVSQNNIKNVVATKNSKSWEDPFVKDSSKYNDVGRKSDSKLPAGVSRPGKLLIRPSSNHPASKTKTEFLVMTKFNDIKKGEFAPAKYPANRDELVNGDTADGSGYPDEDFPSQEEVVIVGGGVSIGKSSLAKTKKGKKLRINFDDSASQTHEYPSEQSLMAEIPTEPGYCDYPEDEVEPIDLASASSLLSSPALTAGQKLYSYVPRNSIDYTFGMDRTEDVVHVQTEVDPEPQPPLPSNGAAFDSADSTTYSNDLSADLLF